MGVHDLAAVSGERDVTAARPRATVVPVRRRPGRHRYDGASLLPVGDHGSALMPGRPTRPVLAEVVVCCVASGVLDVAEVLGAGLSERCTTVDIEVSVIDLRVLAS